MHIFDLVRKCTVLTFVAITAVCTNSTIADLQVTFNETDAGVTITGSGSVETFDGLTYNATTDLVAANQLFVNSTTSQIRSASDSIDFYYADTNFTSFSTMGVTRALASDPGIEFGITSIGTSPSRVYLPSGYTPGTVINFSVFNAGDTLADFGLTAGDTWGATWVTGNANTPTESMMFSATAIPEPGSIALLAVACCTGLLTRRTRQKK